ncbi:MAG: PKD domain-containing protein [Candidatus Marinimicrobia bacterium]|nr:PKD domain-containing protein [Candidatus Neomarinimicrobiota bacterium]
MAIIIVDLSLMLKKLLSLFLILLISCGGGGGGGSDDGGGTGPTDPAPVAIFSGSPTSGPVPLTVGFLSGSTNATTHAWDFDNDGSPDASGSSVSYTYENTGTYSVSLTVTSSGGTDTTTKTDYITVNAVPPTAAFFGAPTSGTPELRVQFTNTSSQYTQSSWSFGDGSTSSEDSPIHTYTATGDYDVSLSVTGEGGSNTVNESAYITLTDIATPAMIVDSKYTDTTTGSSVALDIKVLGVTGLAAAQAKLTFDTSALTIGDVTAGDFLTGNTDPLFIVTNEDGAVTIYTSSLSSDQPTSDGDGVIATVNFTVNGSTNTNLNFDSANTIMLDVNGANIAINGLENGYLILE